MSTKLYDQFNNLAIEFLQRMEETFPNEQKIKVYRQKYEFVKSIKSTKPVEMFMENMYDYGEQILSKNELFFKQDELVQTAQSISGKMGLIKYWDTMNEKTKNSIWEYIQGLYILGMGVIGKQDELNKLIVKTKFSC